MTKFGIFVTRKQHIPTQGHGYPAYDLEYRDLIEFPSEVGIIAWVQHNDESSRPKKYQIIKFETLSIEKSTSYKLG